MAILISKYKTHCMCILLHGFYAAHMDILIQIFFKLSLDSEIVFCMHSDFWILLAMVAMEILLGSEDWTQL